MSSTPIKHLLIPKEFRVWCLPNRPAGKKAVTTEPSKCTCVNCVNAWRTKTQGVRRSFKVVYMNGREHQHKFPELPYRDPAFEVER